jgi:hypothetical protein
VKAVAAVLAALLCMPACASQATGRFRVGITILPPAPSGRVTFQGRVLPDGATTALHPQCVVSRDQVVVRGAVLDLDTNRFVPGARVVVRNGPRYLTGITDGQGHYTIVAPRANAMTVTVVQAAVPGNQSLRVVDALMGRAACTAM